MNVNQKLIDVLNSIIIPVSGKPDDYDSLVDKIGDARFVLIGEATHGTQEFYQARIEITKQLISKKGFMAVAIEGDWPDAYQVHRYLQGADKIGTLNKALDSFKRFPTWMWRNTTLPPFIYWLREFNNRLLYQEKIGFYGLDLYSLHSSMQAVIHYLLKVDPVAARRASERYACFDSLNVDPQTYGYLTTIGIKKSCIKEVTEELLDIQHNAFKYVQQDSITAQDEYFYATQNARLIKNAEMYYRSMFDGRVSSWNVRDKHMMETVNTLADHLENRFKKPAKIIVWAHNSHVGDARATEMSERGEVNIGELMREQHDRDTYLIGFSTYQGLVMAASRWGDPPECKQINLAIPGSYEDLFHQLKYRKFILDLVGNHQRAENFLHIPRLQRAIGVIYRPETEQQSHYFFSRLPYQFDSMIHFDQTTAVQPLD